MMKVYKYSCILEYCQNRAVVEVVFLYETNADHE